MKNIILNFQKPDLKNSGQKITKEDPFGEEDWGFYDGRLHLNLDWGDMGISETIITKIENGYNYEDVGYMKRHFSSLYSMLWEFELYEYKHLIEGLPIKKEPQFIFQMSKEGKEITNKAVSKICKKFKSGSNYTPPKKKRKKK